MTTFLGQGASNPVFMQSKLSELMISECYLKEDISITVSWWSKYDKDNWQQSLCQNARR